MGYVVFSLGVYGHSGDKITEEQKIILDKVHQNKIFLADTIVVINKDGYVGSSTLNQIHLAKEWNKKIVFIQPIQEN